MGVRRAPGESIDHPAGGEGAQGARDGYDYLRQSLYACGQPVLEPAPPTPEGADARLVTFDNALHLATLCEGWPLELIADSVELSRAGHALAMDLAGTGMIDMARKRRLAFAVVPVRERPFLVCVRIIGEYRGRGRCAAVMEWALGRHGCALSTQERQRLAEMTGLPDTYGSTAHTLQSDREQQAGRLQEDVEAMVEALILRRVGSVRLGFHDVDGSICMDTTHLARCLDGKPLSLGSAIEVGRRAPFQVRDADGRALDEHLHEALQTVMDAYADIAHYWDGQRVRLNHASGYLLLDGVARTVSLSLSRGGAGRGYCRQGVPVAGLAADVMTPER